MKFFSKAKTLESLYKKVTKSKILPLYIFGVNDYRAHRNNIINEIRARYQNSPVIIRSSSNDEDTEKGSNAGKYKSVLNIPVDDDKLLQEGIETVIDSMADNVNNEIFVQGYLKNVLLSGVIFTADIDTFAPYYIINYDDSTSKTDTVTSGTTNRLKTLIFYKKAQLTNVQFEPLISAVRELEDIYSGYFLDIEFAINSFGEIYILQVRSISRDKKNILFPHEGFDNYLRKVDKKIRKISQRHPHLVGERTILGVMPDWNPAEIIGTKPRRLSLSLYKELVTDRVWAYQRDNYGYRNLRSFPLLVSLLGIPYIDIRVSFNSFIPKGVNDRLAEKLVTYYLDELEKKPYLHDKVEFEIVFSCSYFGICDKMHKLLSPRGFVGSEIDEIYQSLVSLTNSIISSNSGLIENDLRKIDVLKERYDEIKRSDLSILDKLYWLIEDCKRYGTLPFAGLARSAFISVQFLKSLVDCNVISEYDYDCFMGSINTVSRKFTADLIAMKSGSISEESFFYEYGHLRPGTYDILSPRYDENKSLFSEAVGCANADTSGFTFRDQQMGEIQRLLDSHGLHVTAREFIKFIKLSIESREYSKFEFTKNLSHILLLVEKLGDAYGISREDMSFIDIRTIINLHAMLDHRDLKDILLHDIINNRDEYEITKALRLPSLIVSADDIYEYHLEEGSPNFITLGRIKAEVVSEKDMNSVPIKNKIVFIKSADPGYDWVFSKGIGGLITMYGGANSHMAIRCSELGIPAVIGSGEILFLQWSRHSVIELDCASRQVIVHK